MHITHRSMIFRRAAAVTCVVALGAAAALAWVGAGGRTMAAPAPLLDPEYTILAANDLGMHCMQQDFSEFMILPPYNTIRAVVIRRGIEPEIESEHLTLEYATFGNTRASDKTNFWTYAQALFGVALPPDVGLTGHRLAGTMSRTPTNDWEVTGIPITPVDDAGREDAYPLVTIRARNGPTVLATTQAVVPVSWEIGCNLCHNEPNVSVGTQILRAHDRLHGTTLEAQQPVNCSACHADPALGAPGVPGVSTFSSAMHRAHAPRMASQPLDNECYACHPGNRTNCQRDVHAAAGMDCHACHVSMQAVGDPSRTPWVDQPRCGSCHSRPGFEYEQPGALFRQSVGHGGVPCLACHGSPHAMGPAVNDLDNHQATNQQGYAGPISNCLVCHTEQPAEAFFHSTEH